MPLSHADISYLGELQLLVQQAKDNPIRDDRTGTGTHSFFGSLTSYDISKGQVPILGSKKVSFANILHELIWMLRGDLDITYLQENNCKIWDEWLQEGTNKVSALYPEAWRKWEHITKMKPSEVEEFVKTSPYGTSVEQFGTDVAYVTEYVDQIQHLVKQLKENPNARRHLLTAWHPGRNHRVKLPACHTFAQFYVGDDGKLSTMLYLRSSDHFLGKPYNIVAYAVLTHLLAHLTGMETDSLLVCVGDMHLYSNHVEVANKQIDGSMDIIRSTNGVHQTPFITISPDLTNIDDLQFHHVELHDYIPGPVYRGDVAV